MDNNFSTEEVFESAVSIVRNLPKEGSVKPSDELKLKLYAYYKQATHGKNDTPKPRFYQIVEAYKWDAWRKLGHMSKEDAMLNYIRELKQVMESIPPEKADTESSKHFEDVLGKKFYDYWFKQWEQSNRNQDELAGTDSLLQDNQSSQEHRMTKPSNDTQSNSSRDSSVSMLEETQSGGGDGYKTPNSLAFKETFTGEVSDQFALALLRLQHGLDETVTRVNSLESQLKQSIDCIRRLENQTYAKVPLIERRSGSKEKTFSIDNMIRLIRGLKTAQWFYLSYPILIYLVIRRFERQNQNRSLR